MGNNDQSQIDLPNDIIQSRMISSGLFHTCSLSLINEYSIQFITSIVCWGNDNWGQSTVPYYINASPKVKGLSSGSNTNCVINDLAGILCWGNVGQLNRFNKIESIIPEKFMTSNNVLIDIGMDDTICGLKETIIGLFRSLQCWGKCPNSMCDVPKEWQQGTTLVSVGYDHVCAVSNNKAGCWGGNAYGQTSFNSQFQDYHILQVQAGLQTTCIYRISGQVICYGLNKNISDKILSYSQVVSSGGRHTCSIQGGYVSCWGDDSLNQLTPSSLTQNGGAIMVDSGWDQSCALFDANHAAIHCWGWNYLGQTDIPNNITSKPKFDIPQVAVGLNHSCAIQLNYLNKNQVVCWGGHNEWGQTSTPLLQQDLQEVAVGDEHTCILQWQVNCFGNNSLGQLESAMTSQQDKIVSIKAGGAHSCAELSSAYLFTHPNLLNCWGSDQQGQINIPEMFRGTKIFASLSLGVAQTCVVWKKPFGVDSSVLCWGMVMNQNLMREGHYLTAVSAGWEHNCVIDLDGRVQCVGENDWGQCGQIEEQSGYQLIR